MSANYVRGVGPIPNRWAIFGEGPGKTEDRGRYSNGAWVRAPFIGPTGQLLDSILDANRIPRDLFYISNIVKRRISVNGKDESPTLTEIEFFRPDVEEELAHVQPEIVIAAGGPASRWFLGPTANLERMHGLPHLPLGPDSLPSWPFVVVPCYHPAAGLHETDQMEAVYWDYAQAAKFLRGEIGVHQALARPTRIIPLPERLLGRHATIGLDTEFKPDGTPICLTASFADGLGSWVNADDHEALHRIARWSRNPDYTFFIHNAMTDLSPLRQMEIDLGRCFLWDRHRTQGFARAIDTMVLIFEQGKVHTQGLKTLAYRLLSTLMQSYEDIVGPVQERMALRYLQDILPVWPDPEPEPHFNAAGDKLSWSHPWGMNRRINRILKDYAERGGIWPNNDEESGVNLVARWEHIEPEKRRELEEFEGGKMPVADLSHCDPAVAQAYACNDSDLTRQLGILALKEHERRDLMPIALIDHGALPLTERMQANGMPAKRQHFIDMGAEMRVLQTEIAEMLSLLIGREINPKSSDQVAELLYAEMGLDPVLYTKKGRPSTGKKALQHLRDQNPLVDWILQSREYGKMDDAFCENIADRIEEVRYDPVAHLFLKVVAKTHPQAEFRAFYQLMITRVKTGRLAAKNFNALAIPNRTKLGRRLEAGFECLPGRSLLGIDESQIEMRTMAHESSDASMLEIYNRDPEEWPKWERDLHIHSASLVFDAPKSAWATPTQQLDDWRIAIKSCGFGILMGIMGKGLSEQMRLYGLNPTDWPEDRCTEFIAEWLKVFPGVQDYQLRRRSEARRTGEVVDMFGRHFALPQVRCPLSWIREEALRQSHALPIQAGAQAIEKKGMAEFDNEELPALQVIDYCEPTLQVHDALYVEAATWIMPLVRDRLMDCLTNKERLGLQAFKVPLEADAKIGSSWGTLSK